MASAANSILERKPEPSVRVQEEDGHLQPCFFDMLSSIGNGVRDPQVLWDHSSDFPDTTVKHARVLIGKADDERAAVWSKVIRGRDDLALQNVREVPLSRLGTETMGYVPVHQKL
jgi:hypothetical protein